MYLSSYVYLVQVGAVRDGDACAPIPTRAAIRERKYPTLPLRVAMLMAFPVKSFLCTSSVPSVNLQQPSSSDFCVGELCPLSALLVTVPLLLLLLPPSEVPTLLVAAVVSIGFTSS